MEEKLFIEWKNRFEFLIIFVRQEEMKVLKEDF